MKKIVLLFTFLVISQAHGAEKLQRLDSSEFTAAVDQSSQVALSDIERMDRQICPSGQIFTAISYDDLRPLLSLQLLFGVIAQPSMDSDNPEANLVLNSSEKFVLDKKGYAVVKTIQNVLDQVLSERFKDQASLQKLMSGTFASFSQEIKSIPTLSALGNDIYLIDTAIYYLFLQLAEYKEFLRNPIPCLRFRDVAAIKYYTSNSNYYLHLNHPELLPSQLYPALKIVHQRINESLKKFPVPQMQVQIGTALPSKELMSLRKGDILPYQNFLSGSLDNSFMGFAQNTILVVQNRKGRFIGKINPTESEVLFYNPQFKLKEKKIDENGRYWLFLEEI